MTEIPEPIARWIGEPADRYSVVALPHLSTPQFTVFLVARANVSHGDRHIVVIDGEEVLPASTATFGEILLREGLLADPTAVPPDQLANLFCSLASAEHGPPCGSSIDDLTRSVLKLLPPNEWVRVRLPAITTEPRSGGFTLHFWATGRKPLQVLEWTVHIDPYARITARHRVLPVEPV